MALDRQATALAILRICIGTFFFFEGLSKIGWFADASILAAQLASWSRSAAPGSISHWYLTHVALPWAVYFARLVPLGEMCSGIALILGLWAPLFAFVAFFMALNFQVASGAIFNYSFLTSGYGLPVLGSTLALTFGGVRQSWSIRA